MSALTLGLADYPSELDDDLTLPNQRRLHIRALRRGEESSIRELDAHLSVRTRYLRFLSPLPALPDSLTRLLASVDYRRKLALVAEYHNGSAREIIGLGSFGAVDDNSAEVGLVVSDEWQRLHVGTELATRVLQAAEDRGFHRFIVHVLAENVAIRGLLKKVGVVVSARMHGSVSELAFVRRQPI